MSAQALNFENLDGGTGVALSKEELYMAVLTEYLKTSTKKEGKARCVSVHNKLLEAVSSTIFTTNKE